MKSVGSITISELYDGISITDVDVEYAISASNTAVPTSGWQTIAPTWENGKYIWSRTKTTYSNGTTTYTNPACITGGKGETGTGVSSITEEYYLSTSKTTQTGGSWTTTPPTWSTGKYLWTRSKIVYSNPSSTVYTTPVCNDSWEAANEAEERMKYYVHSRGENLVTNGTGLLGNNTNFSAFTFDGSEAYYSAGSFRYTGQSTRFTDEFMPVDLESIYRLSMVARTQGGTGRYYAMVGCYDVDNNAINASNHMYRANTLTTLAQELKNGDTVVHLNDASNWYNIGTAGVSTHLRSIILWNYVNSFGYQYPALTYSRKWTGNAWDPGAIDFVNNTITLRIPWEGGTVPVGTELSNGSSGGTYKYLAMSNTYVPTTWTAYSGIMNGVDLSGTNAGGKFPPGTAKTKIGWLLNYQGSGETIWITNLSLALATAPTMKVQYSQDNSSWHDSYLSTDTYMRTSNNDGATWSAGMRIVGEDGVDGGYRDFEFAIGTMSEPTGTWQTNPPSAETNEYIWMRSRWIDSEGAAGSWSTPTRIKGDQGDKGDKGDQGIPGPSGSDGQSLYTWVKFADNSSGGGMSDNPAGKKYLGLAYNKPTAAESTTAGDYTWSKIEGDQGIQGPEGPEGESLFTWVRYADNDSGSGMSASPAGKEYIGIAYNKNSPTPSSTPGDYTWSLYKGPKGDKGDTGDTGPIGPEGPEGQRGASSVGLGVKVNYSAFGTQNPGEVYLHGFDINGSAADVNGFVYFQDEKLTVNKRMVNPDAVFDGFLVLERSTGNPYAASYHYLNNHFFIHDGSYGKDGYIIDELGWLFLGRMINDQAEHTRSALVYDRAKDMESALREVFTEVIFRKKDISQAEFDALMANTDTQFFDRLAADEAFVNVLTAQEGFIYWLRAQDIVVENQIRSSNYTEGGEVIDPAVPGFHLSALGRMIAHEASLHKASIEGSLTHDALETKEEQAGNSLTSKTTSLDLWNESSFFSGFNASTGEFFASVTANTWNGKSVTHALKRTSSAPIVLIRNTTWTPNYGQGSYALDPQPPWGTAQVIVTVTSSGMNSPTTVSLKRNGTTIDDGRLESSSGSTRTVQGSVSHGDTVEIQLTSIDSWARITHVEYRTGNFSNSIIFKYSDNTFGIAVENNSSKYRNVSWSSSSPSFNTNNILTRRRGNQLLDQYNFGHTGFVSCSSGNITVNGTAYTVLRMRKLSTFLEIEHPGGYVSIHTFVNGSSTGAYTSLSATAIQLIGQLPSISTKHIIPKAHNSYDLGESTNRFRTLYLQGIFASGTIDGNVNSQGTTRRVWGAVFN